MHIFPTALTFYLDNLIILIARSRDSRAPPISVREMGETCPSLYAGCPEGRYACGCWTTCLIQEWIFQQFGVLYSRYYVAELLHNLGLSYQKACFVSDHLDEAARQQWMEKIWPGIVTRATSVGCQSISVIKSVLPNGIAGLYLGTQRTTAACQDQRHLAKATRNLG